MPERILDFHVHLFTNYDTLEPGVKSLLEKAYPGKVRELLERYSTPEQLTALLDESGVKQAVVLAEYCPGVTTVVTNKEVAQVCRQAPRCIPFANINPHLVTDLIKELEYCVEDLGCRGVKLLPSYQNWHPLESRMYRLYEAAQALKIPLLFHTGSSVFPGTRLRYADPLWLDDIAVDFPKLVLIQAHSGRGFWYDRAFFLARLHENVYMEISGLPPQNLFKYFPEFERNADKIIFGSDWPSTGPISRNIQGILALPISERSKEKILWENGAKILGISKAPPF